MAGWGVTGRTCSSLGSACPARWGWWLFHSRLLSAAVLMQRYHPKSGVIFRFCRTCRSRLNIAMAEPSAPRLRGQLWKSMVSEGWMQKKIPETTKDAFLIVCRLMFFVFTSRNVNCGALLAQLKEWFDYQQREKKIDLKAGRRSRLKTRWYIWARQSPTWQNTSVLALLILEKRSHFTEIDFQWSSFTSITLGQVVKGT